MTKAQHTPGPWECHYLPQHRLRITAQEGTVTICEHGLWPTDYSEQAANLRLIEEAPAMLDALRALLEDEGLILDCLNQMEGRGAEDRNAERFDTVRAILSRIGGAE
jgi:hypothetical protein